MFDDLEHLSVTNIQENKNSRMGEPLFTPLYMYICVCMNICIN